MARRPQGLSVVDGPIGQGQLSVFGEGPFGYEMPIARYGEIARSPNGLQYGYADEIQAWSTYAEIAESIGGVRVVWIEGNEKPSGMGIRGEQPNHWIWVMTLASRRSAPVSKQFDALLISDEWVHGHSSFLK